eukprot:6846478-Pyramimonas_sp.AAC.1
MNKSSADALENLNRAEQRQRTWANSEGARLRLAAAGRTFSSGQPGAVPAWRPDSAAAQPSA